MNNMMQYKGYYGSVNFEEETLTLYGKIEFIKSLISYEAPDARGLRQLFQEAVDDYLETCIVKNLQPEISLKGNINVRLGEKLHRRIAILATDEHISINKFIINTLDKATQAYPGIT